MEVQKGVVEQSIRYTCKKNMIKKWTPNDAKQPIGKILSALAVEISPILSKPVGLASNWWISSSLRFSSSLAMLIDCLQCHHNSKNQELRLLWGLSSKAQFLNFQWASVNADAYWRLETISYRSIDRVSHDSNQKVFSRLANSFIMASIFPKSKSNEHWSNFHISDESALNSIEMQFSSGKLFKKSAKSNSQLTYLDSIPLI